MLRTCPTDDRSVLPPTKRRAPSCWPRGASLLQKPTVTHTGTRQQQQRPSRVEMTSFSVTRRKIYSAARERRDDHVEPAAPPSKTTRRFLPRHRTHLLPLLAHSLPAIFTRGVVFRLSDQLNTRAIWTDAIELMNSRPTVAHRRRLLRNRRATVTTVIFIHKHISSVQSTYVGQGECACVTSLCDNKSLLAQQGRDNRVPFRQQV